jgi:hypothetical protein
MYVSAVAIYLFVASSTIHFLLNIFFNVGGGSDASAEHTAAIVQLLDINII